jgi:hypothetical protein
MRRGWNRGPQKMKEKNKKIKKNKTLQLVEGLAPPSFQFFQADLHVYWK